MKPLFKSIACYLFLCCFIVGKLYAQTEIDTTFAHAMTTTFGNIDRSKVPYGILRDFGMEFTNLENYDGIATLADSNLVDEQSFWDVYNTLASARIHNSASGFLYPDTIANRWYNYRQPGRITLAGLYFNYAYYGSGATSNTTISNNKVYDKYVNGTWQNPYSTSQVFAISPSINDYSGTSFSVLLPVDLFFSNSAGSVSSISANFGDGNGYVTVTPGTEIALNYADTGLKVWTYKLTLTNNTVLYSHSTIQVNLAVTSGQSSSNYTTFCSGCPAAGTAITIQASQAYLGVTGEAFITIHYGNSSGKLLKPLIVAEGFDAGHITAPEKKFGSTNIQTFNDQVSTSGSTDLNNFLASNYDIVYVDWKNGTDYIERNALVLEEVIRWVNSHKDPLPSGGYAPNVILGQSMGGLIARYALKNMENNNENHQTGLYISWDAPHQGANVPEAYQRLANHVKSLYLSTVAGWVTELILAINNKPSIKRILSLSNEPAAKEMLINRIDASTNTINNTAHQNWQASLVSLGYPQGVAGIPFRMIAVSNGSECAKTEPFNPGDNLFTFNGDANTRFLGDLAATVASPFVGTLVSPAFFLMAIPGRNQMDFDFRGYAQADGTSNLIYTANISYTKTILWVINVTVTLTNRNEYASAATLPYDYFPGGSIDVTNSSTTANLQSTSGKNWFGKYNISFNINPTFCFIPTTSALDIGVGATTITKTDYLTAYVGANPPVTPKNTPFVNFITAFPSGGSGINEPHIAIEKRNGDWVAAELNASPQTVNCSGFCSNNTITTTNSIVCNSETFTAPFGNGVNYIWTVSNPSLVNLAPNGNTVTITRNGTSNGVVTLSVNISGACGSTTLNTTVTIGSPTPTYIDYSIDPIVNCNEVLVSSNYTAGSTYTWSYFNQPYSGNLVQFPNSSATKKLTLTQGSGTYNIGVTATNTCGTSDIYFISVPIDCSSPVGGHKVTPKKQTATATSDYNEASTTNKVINTVKEIAIYPNPANKTITVTIPQTEKVWLTATIIILDEQGRAVKTISTANTVTTIDITSLAQGSFLVKIFDGKSSTVKKLLKY